MPKPHNAYDAKTTTERCGESPCAMIGGFYIEEKLLGSIPVTLPALEAQNR